MKNSIYNTVDDVPVSQSVQKITDFMACVPELNWAALIDTSFDYDNGKPMPDFGPLINCYDYAELQGLKAIAPCLVELAHGSCLRAQVAKIIRHCQGRPMLSFVGTTQCLKVISSKWRSIHMVSVVDEQKMLLRFADTRVLSYLSRVLTMSQWTAICGVVSCWVYFDRAGGLVTWESPGLTECTENILVTKDQLGVLLDKSRPDALMALIVEEMCDIVSTGKPVSERYRIIKDSYALSKKHAINESADILALAVAACLTQGRSNIDQRLESLLRQRTWATGSLGDAIADAELI